jgi:hypothetical protein
MTDSTTLRDYTPRSDSVINLTLQKMQSVSSQRMSAPNELEVIKGALCHAGGKWASPWHREKQCDFQPLHPADGRAIYCLQNQARVKRLIRGRVISITTPLRRRAKELWSVLRAARRAGASS